MTDQLYRFVFDQLPIRGEWVSLEDSYQTIMRQHGYPSVVRQLLGEALVLCVLLAETIKFKGQLTLQMQSDGPITLLVAKCDEQGQIRGLAKWQEDLLLQDVAAALGKGEIVITMMPHDEAKPYQSIVQIREGSLRKSLEFYFEQSEQLPTRIWVSSDDSVARGVLLQRLPGSDPESKDAWETAVLLADTVQEEEIKTLTVADLLNRLFYEYDVRLFDPKNIQFFCNCSHERMQAAVFVLGKEEALEVLTQRKELVVKCDYCSNEYAFNRMEVDEIFAEHGGNQEPLH